MVSFKKSLNQLRLMITNRYNNPNKRFESDLETRLTIMDFLESDLNTGEDGFVRNEDYLGVIPHRNDQGFLVYNILGIKDQPTAIEVQARLALFGVENTITRSLFWNKWCITISDPRFEEKGDKTDFDFKLEAVPFQYDPNLIVWQNCLRGSLSSQGIQPFADYSNIDIDHYFGGLEVEGIRDLETARQIQGILTRTTCFPYTSRYTRDRGGTWAVSSETRIDPVNPSDSDQEHLIEMNPEDVRSQINHSDQYIQSHPAEFKSRFVFAGIRKMEMKIGVFLYDYFSSKAGQIFCDTLKQIQQKFLDSGICFPKLYVKNFYEEDPRSYKIQIDGNEITGSMGHKPSHEQANRQFYEDLTTAVVLHQRDLIDSYKTRSSEAA